MKQLLEKIYWRIRYLYGKSTLYLVLLGIFGTFKWTAGLWYLISGGFGREQKAILSGRYRHLCQLRKTSADGAVYTLRRNTHRIEKGLIMRPRRDVFAREYILQTCQIFSELSGNPASRAEQADLIAWSKSVLGEFFQVTKEEGPLATAKKVYEEAVSTTASQIESVEKPRKPYHRDLDGNHISIAELKHLAIQRRSCRWFLPTPVPREKIDQALEIGTLAPSACNRQPYQFLFYDDLDLVQQVAKLPGGTTGFADNFPCMCVIVGELSAFPHDRDRHIPYIDASLAAMGFLFALEIQGISSCCINWPDVEFRERNLADLLGLRDDQRAIMLIALGYPDPEGMVPFSQKKSINEVRVFNQSSSSVGEA